MENQIELLAVNPSILFTKVRGELRQNVRILVGNRGGETEARLRLSAKGFDEEVPLGNRRARRGGSGRFGLPASWRWRRDNSSSASDHRRHHRDLSQPVGSVMLRAFHRGRNEESDSSCGDWCRFVDRFV